MELAKRYTDFTELTVPILHEFIEKVIVHEADRSSGRREQRVDVYLNYIGQFDVPEEYDTVKKPPLPLPPTEEQRAKWREYKRRERERELAAEVAAQAQPPQYKTA